MSELEGVYDENGLWEGKYDWGTPKEPKPHSFNPKDREAYPARGRWLFETKDSQQAVEEPVQHSAEPIVTMVETPAMVDPAVKKWVDDFCGRAQALKHRGIIDGETSDKLEAAGTVAERREGATVETVQQDLWAATKWLAAWIKEELQLFPQTFKCGHDRAGNTTKGSRGGKCRLCWNKYQREYHRERRAKGVKVKKADLYQEIAGLKQMIEELKKQMEVKNG